MSNEVEQRALSQYLEDHNLKHTKQREAILDVFLSVRGHITGEDLYRRVRERHEPPREGLARAMAGPGPAGRLARVGRGHMHDLRDQADQARYSAGRNRTDAALNILGRESPGPRA